MTSPNAQGNLQDLLGRVGVVPVLTIHDAGKALPLGRALRDGGLHVLEVTLRTAAALESIRRLQGEAGVVVGAGTVTRPAELVAVGRAGAAFAVSPGLTADLAAAAADAGVPLLPGVMTPSEAMTARDRGFTFLKLFPAKVAGGVAFLKAIGAPLPDLAFCPTGGIGPGDFRDYLALSNVVCVGGSWVAPAEDVEAGDWEQITRLARETNVPSGGPRGEGTGS